MFGFGVKVARARPDSVSNVATWSYWSGREWSADSADAVTVVQPVGGVDQTFSVVARDGKFYAISKKDGFLGSDLAVWAASSPHGPFASPVTTGRIPNRRNNTVLLYMPLAQPDLPTADPNSVVVQIHRNTTDLELLRSTPLLYRPFAIELRLPPEPSTADLEKQAGGPPAPGLPPL